MLLCPISPHLTHPDSLHCSALSQAVSSFWSQQQCYSINPLAGYATVYKWCCFLPSKSVYIISVMLSTVRPGIQITFLNLGCLYHSARYCCLFTGPVCCSQCVILSWNIYGYAYVHIRNTYACLISKVTVQKGERKAIYRNNRILLILLSLSVV